MRSKMKEPTQSGADTSAPFAKKEVVVFMNRQNSTCAECRAELPRGGFLRMEGDRPLCLDCADLGHLEYLPAGNTALTRRATRHSPLRAVVVQWSRARKRYERQGILVAPGAIDRAEKECEADEDVRSLARVRAAVRREQVDREYQATVTSRLKELFPGCPAAEAEEIANWTCQKHSGRVGRSSGAKALDPLVLRLAVIAHIRHVHTTYDSELMAHGDRSQARAQVAAAIDRILTRWEKPPGAP